MFLLGLIPWWGKIIAVVAIAASLYGGYRVWRHDIWVEGRDAVLTAVAKENAQAKAAAVKVQITTDACFDAGGSWDVTTGSCNTEAVTAPAGAVKLFGG